MTELTVNRYLLQIKEFSLAEKMTCLVIFKAERKGKSGLISEHCSVIILEQLVDL